VRKTKRQRITHTTQRARRLFHDPYYQLLRNAEWGFGYTAKDALRGVREYDALTKGIEVTMDEPVTRHRGVRFN